MPYIWTKPDEVVTHCGVTVFHVYKDGYWECGCYEFKYTTDITESADYFDIRDLKSYQTDMDHVSTLMDHVSILKQAIERGEITAPAE